MANNNRTEAGAAIEALAAVVDLEELKEAMNDFFAQSCVFRKDVSATDSTSASAKTLNFLDIDYIAVTQDAGFTTYTLSNVQQGEIKYLKIIKSSGQRAGFASPVTDTTAFPDVFLLSTEILYKITNKDGTEIFATPISKSIISATETIEGIVEKATATERDAGTPDKYIDAELLAANTGGLLKKVIEIGDWNMLSTASVNVTHGLTLANIRSVSVMIRNDVGTFQYPLNFSQLTNNTVEGNVWSISTTQVQLFVVTGSLFESTAFDSTSYNRGWVIIEYAS